MKTLFNTSVILIIVFISSCSFHRSRAQKIPKKKTSYFYLTDRSGRFLLQRDTLYKNGKIITRSLVSDLVNTSLPLEKSVVVSQVVGKEKNILRPSISQYNIWYDEKNYFSQLKTNIKKKSLDVLTKSPQKDWNGRKSVDYPKGKVFCFFSQIPECLKFYNLLLEKRKIGITVIWDNYPYHIESYTNISNAAFQKSLFQFESESGQSKRYRLELGNQIILYEFDVNFEFDKMYWVAQGITLIRRT